jgi:hypothetical protein
MKLRVIGFSNVAYELTLSNCFLKILNKYNKYCYIPPYMAYNAIQTMVLGLPLINA